ncbi:MAG: TetR/AcrR family transcriptional regulator [Parvularculaceae bacterium]
MGYTIRPPRQHRSAESLERLVEASIELMSEDVFDNTSITEILTKANCSVGAFYGRFDSKESLFHYTHERVLTDITEWLDNRFQKFERAYADQNSELGARTVCRFIIETVHEFYARKPNLYRALFLHTRIRRDPALLKRVEGANTVILKRTEALCARIKPEREGPARLSRWLKGLKVIAAYLREEVLFGGAFPSGEKTDVSAEIDELERLYLAYVRVNNNESDKGGVT